MPFISKLGTFIAGTFKSSPQLSNSVTGLVTFSAGDVLSQKFLNEGTDVDFGRAIKTGMLGVFMNGVVLHHWYNTLDRVFGKSMSSTKGVVLKMAADQLIYAPFSIAVFFGFASSLATMEATSQDTSSIKRIEMIPGKVVELLIEKMENSFLPTLLADCCVWPFVNLINFSYIPKNYRPSFVGFAQLIWQTFVSSMGHGSASSTVSSSEEILNSKDEIASYSDKRKTNS
jgi:protein Mpv17